MRSVPFRTAAIWFVVAVAAGCQRTQPKQQDMPPPQVTVAKPVTYPVQNYREYNGHLAAVEMVEIKARVKGLLQDIQFTEGQEVEKGARLYTIDPREYRAAVARATADVAKAAADIENWSAQIKLAEAELRRSTRTAMSGATSQSDVDKARATVDVNTAQLAVSRASKDAAEAALEAAKIQLGYTDIRAPISGRISRTLVTKGNLVGQDQPTLLTTIVSMDPIYVYFDAPERDLVEYQRTLREHAESPAAYREVTVEVGIATEDGYPHPGLIDFRENRVDVGTGTIRLRGRIPNPPVEPINTRLLYPGLYSRVRVPAGQPVTEPIIPEEALMTGQEGRFVFVLGPGDVVAKRNVTVGRTIWQAPPPDEAAPPGWALARLDAPPPAGGDPAPVREPLRSVVAIEKGLEPSDRVIVSGLQKARPGSPVTPDNWELRPPPTGGNKE